MRPGGKNGHHTFYRTMNRLCSVLCTVSSGNCGLPYVISIQVSSIAGKQTFFLIWKDRLGHSDVFLVQFYVAQGKILSA